MYQSNSLIGGEESHTEDAMRRELRFFGKPSQSPISKRKVRQSTRYSLALVLATCGPYPIKSGLGHAV